MSHSPEQKRQKDEAMREAARHAEHSTVDGSPNRGYGMDVELSADSRGNLRPVDPMKSNLDEELAADKNGKLQYARK